MGPLSDLLDPHRTWGLWVQAPLILAVIAVTWRDLGAAARQGGLGVPSIVAAAGVTGLLFAWLPWEFTSWSGHQGHYLELLQQVAPEAGSLERTLTFPAPAALAWALGAALPDPIAEAAFLLANRLALPVTLLALGAVAGHLAAPRQRTAALAGVVLGALAVPLLAWSTTGFSVAPAHACVALGLLLAVNGRPVGALGWIGLALATRAECGVFLPIVLLLPGRSAWRAAAPQWITASAAIGIELTLLAAKDSGLPGWPVLDVAVENLGNLPLGGPWFSWAALTLAVAVVVVGPPDALRGRVGVLWALGLVASVLQISTVLDLGARHLLPPTLLIVPAVAAAVALAPGRRAQAVLCLALGLALVASARSELVDLRHQLIAEEPGVLPRWSSAADVGPSGSLGQLIDPACLVALPGGAAVHSAAVDAFDVGLVHEARAALDAGRCVQWAVRPGTRFAGDTQLEFLDRAVRTLRLSPVGWLTLDDGRRWMLMQSGP